VGVELPPTDRDNVLVSLLSGDWTMRGVAVVFILAVLVGGCSAGSSERPVPTATQRDVEAVMKLSPPAFQHEDTIPERYTCDGSDISPPLKLRDIPEAAVSLVLVMDDPDAPRGVWDHWVAFDVAPVGAIDEAIGTLGTPGTNS
jgi:hypothetical protein